MFQNVDIHTYTPTHIQTTEAYYKSMETLSCHSNESTWATTIKNIIYVEANVMNMYAKFQLHLPYGF